MCLRHVSYLQIVLEDIDLRGSFPVSCRTRLPWCFKLVLDSGRRLPSSGPGSIDLILEGDELLKHIHLFITTFACEFRRRSAVTETSATVLPVAAAAIVAIVAV